MGIPTRTLLLLLLAALAAALLVLAAPALRPLIGGAEKVPLLLLLAFLVAVFAMAGVFWLVVRHLDALRRLRGVVVMLISDEVDSVPRSLAPNLPPEVGRLGIAIDELVSRRLAEQAKPDQRLGAVLASISEAIVVITEAGQVSLVNAAARNLLGSERVAVGTSVFAALTRRSLEPAIDEARDTRRPVAAIIHSVSGEELEARVFDLGDHGGAVLTFPVETIQHHAEIEHDLALHDTPPEPAPFTAETPLNRLPILVLDVETTGLDPRRDAIVSVGGVRMHGSRIYRSAVIDRLVNPGRPIPPRSTAIHGITDDMVRGTAGFGEIWAVLEPMIRGTVVVGHNIGFDVAHLRRATAELALDWTPPQTLDTLLLTAALDPEMSDYSLDAVAERLGVNVRGRHTALGDCLVTAEIFQRLIPRLADAGVATLGAALGFSKNPRSILAKQRRAGW